MKRIREEYRTGLEQIDAEHVKLLDLTDQARKLFEDENMLFKCADIRKILAGLQTYTAEHFAMKRSIWSPSAMTGWNCRKKQHRIFEQKLEEFTERVSHLSIGTQDDMIRDLFEYLQQWLHDHIKKEDMKYVDFGNGKTQENR